MRKTFLSLVAVAGLALLTFNPLLAQEQEQRVANRLVYAELGGPGVLMSVHFDSRFDSESRLGFGYRLGVGHGVRQERTDGGWYWRTRTYATIPIGLNYVFGRPDSPHALEVGVGTTILTHSVSLFTWGYERPGHFIGTVSFMYRRMPVDGGFSWRIGITPMIGTSGDVVPMGGVGFGFVF